MTQSEWLRKTHPESASLAYWNSTVKKPPARWYGDPDDNPDLALFEGLAFSLSEEEE